MDAKIKFPCILLEQHRPVDTKNIAKGIKRAGFLPLFVVPLARLERAAYCSASKRSNPLSYEGVIEE